MNKIFSTDRGFRPQTPQINHSKPRSPNPKIPHQDLRVASHHRSLSADFCRCSSASIITVRKRIQEPQPPPRRASLLNNQITSNPTFKRYSCPPIGICRSPSSSSNSSSSSSSCSSPPPVQTSAITGRDPLGWKLRPKSSSLRSNRLSLQTPLAVSDKATTGDSTSPTKPARRHNSDSSALLRCTVTPLPVKSVGELQQVRLRPMAQLSDCDDVFRDQKKDGNARARPKVPPQVPYKSPMARQISRLMLASYQRQTKEQDIYSTVKKKPNPETHRAEEQDK